MDNRITHISPALGSLTRLTNFNVTHNPDLVCPPPEVYTQGVKAILNFLQRVEKGFSHGQVELSSLRIETLSLPWESLAPGLRALLLSRNVIKALPDSVASLTSLTALWVDNNQLSALPSHIGTCTRRLVLFFDLACAIDVQDLVQQLLSTVVCCPYTQVSIQQMAFPRLKSCNQPTGFGSFAPYKSLLDANASARA